MKKLIISMNLTLDGYLADVNGGLDWHLETWGEDMNERLTKELSQADTILLGRNTYEAMATFWPGRDIDLSRARDDIAFAVMINQVQKVVYSKTLSNTAWKNSVLISGKLEAEVNKLKASKGAREKNIILFGSRMLAKALMSLDLIDEYQLWIHPILLGKGKSLFNGSRVDTYRLRLYEQQCFRSGVMLLCYRRV
jgi:dihydrofolate reductase